MTEAIKIASAPVGRSPDQAGTEFLCNINETYRIERKDDDLND